MFQGARTQVAATRQTLPRNACLLRMPTRRSAHVCCHAARVAVAAVTTRSISPVMPRVTIRRYAMRRFRASDFARPARSSPAHRHSFAMPARARLPQQCRRYR